MMTKKCSKCNIIIDIKEFSLDKYCCKKCRNKTARIRQKYERSILNNSYIKKLIVAESSLGLRDIPDEMVEAKKELIKIQRFLRNV
tara:strand:- start:568 stop:825 length:258 start_codon:yes stop_codon:yes gene_type:complete